jgi:CheY-like chemotaxis protein
MNAETAKTKTIVFVEDNPVVLAAYGNQLQREGFRVESAQDGLEAMKILSRLVPDLVILDLLLPKLSGVDVLKFIHSQPRLKTVPVFVLSTNSVVDAAEEPVLERANQRLLKNACTPAIIVEAVQKLFAVSPAPGDNVPTNQAANSQPAEAKTIVFVEDDPVVLAAYRDRLQAAGFHIQAVQDGLEAMKILSGLVPDLVILDLLLPIFNGMDVLKYIQSDPRLKAVPVIVLSTNSIIDTAEEYVLERADERLLKSSCTPAILLQTIQKLLASGSAAEQSNGAEPADSKTGGVLAGTHGF